MTEEKKEKNIADMLVEAGVHFGHRVANWNPKMKNFIYGKRNKIHIINIRETIKGIVRAQHLLKSFISDGKGKILIVGTKKEAKETVRRIGQELNLPFVAERWLGGSLTNFEVVRSRLARLEELEELERTGIMEDYSKKYQVRLRREMHKILRNLGGIRHMTSMPDLMIIVDTRISTNAIKEAIQLDIPTIGLVDTDSDPDLIDVVIPGNDDSYRSIEVMLMLLADAIREGQKEYKSKAGAMEKIAAEESRNVPRQKTPGKKSYAQSSRKDTRRKPANTEQADNTTTAKAKPVKTEKPAAKVDAKTAKPAEPDKPLRLRKKKLVVGDKTEDKSTDKSKDKTEEPKK